MYRNRRISVQRRGRTAIDFHRLGGATTRVAARGPAVHCAMVISYSRRGEFASVPFIFAVSRAPGTKQSRGCLSCALGVLPSAGILVLVSVYAVGCSAEEYQAVWHRLHRCERSRPQTRHGWWEGEGCIIDATSTANSYKEREGSTGKIQLIIGLVSRRPPFIYASGCTVK